MPCAAGELCLIPDQSLGPNQGDGCRGGCGGRLHGLCGEQEEEDGSELYRICSTCASKRFAGAASKAVAGKPKTRENATSGSKREKGGAGKKADRTAPRTRLSVEEKMALLAEVDNGISQELWLGGSSARCGRSRASSKTGRTPKSRPTQKKNAYIVRDTHYIGENLCCAGARYSAGEVACTIPALYRRPLLYQDIPTYAECHRAMNVAATRDQLRQCMEP